MSLVVIKNGEYVEISPCFYKLDDLGLPNLDEPSKKGSVAVAMPAVEPAKTRTASEYLSYAREQVGKAKRS